MITRNWSGLGHEVAKGIQEAERQRERERVDNLMAEERIHRRAVIEEQMGKPVTSEEVENLVALFVNTQLGPGSLALLKDKDAGRIINALVMMNEELYHLRKIYNNVHFCPNGDLGSFCGLPVEEAIDRVLGYPAAEAYVPHVCKTCKYRSGYGGEMDYPNAGDMRAAPGEFWCANTRDNVCRWEFSGECLEDPGCAEWVEEVI